MSLNENFGYPMIKDTVDSVFHFLDLRIVVLEGEIRLSMVDKQAIRSRAAETTSPSAWQRCQNEVCRELLDLMECEGRSGSIAKELRLVPSDLADPDRSDAALGQALLLIERQLMMRMSRIVRFRYQADERVPA